MIRLALPLLLFVLSLAACNTPRTAPPVIVVVTATPDAADPTQPAPSVAPTATTSASGEPTATPDTSAAKLQATDVKYVLAKQDINIRSGPGTSFGIVGGVFAGNTAQVTGYKSEDGNWWRVVCPTDAATYCWISADPALTEPAAAPQTAPTPTETA